MGFKGRSWKKQKADVRPESHTNAHRRAVNMHFSAVKYRHSQKQTSKTITVQSQLFCAIPSVKFPFFCISTCSIFSSFQRFRCCAHASVSFCVLGFVTGLLASQQRLNAEGNAAVSGVWVAWQWVSWGRYELCTLAAGFHMALPSPSGSSPARAMCAETALCRWKTVFGSQLVCVCACERVCLFWRLCWANKASRLFGVLCSTSSQFIEAIRTFLFSPLFYVTTRV